MAKTYLSHAKYVIHQKFEIKGVVDKHDIIGAIFGQSEGIIGEDLDLRELQGSGKIGRIEIELESRGGVTNGTLTIPSGSDMVETSILAATIEVVDKVGPCDAKFETAKIEDTRITKRKQIIDRAKSLLTRLVTEEIPDSQEIANEVRAEVRISEIIEYGPDRLPAGPHITDAEEIIVVEGRADVMNLLKYNIRNVVAMGGSKIPPSIVELCKKREVIAFVDGDRGGELDLKRLLQIAEIDYITRAPSGREVEELTKKEILAALSKKIPVVQTKAGEKVAVDDLELGSSKYWENNEKDSETQDDQPLVSVKEYMQEEKKQPQQFSQGAQKPSYNIYNNNFKQQPRKDFNNNRYEQRDNRRPEFRNDFRNENRDNRFDNRHDNKPRFDKPFENRQHDRPPERHFEPKPAIQEKLFDQPAQVAQQEFDGVEERNEMVQDVFESRNDFRRDHRDQPVERKSLPTDTGIDIAKEMKELKNSLKARFYDKSGKMLSEVQVKDLVTALKDKKQDANTILFDGIATKRLVELAKNKGTKYLICAKQGKMSYIKGIEVFEHDA